MAKKRKLVMGPIEKRWRDDEVVVSTWFERDRAFVGIQDVETTDYLAEWWDEEVGGMVEDGFFKPSNDLSVIKYADEIGIPAHPPAGNPRRKTPHLGVHPRDYTVEQQQEVTEWLATLPLRELRRRQDINRGQQDYAYKQLEEHPQWEEIQKGEVQTRMSLGYENLRMTEDLLQEAVLTKTA